MGHGPLRPATVVRHRSRAFPNRPDRRSPAGRVHRLTRSRLQKFRGRSIGRQRQTVALRDQQDILLRHNGPKIYPGHNPKDALGDRLFGCRHPDRPDRDIRRRIQGRRHRQRPEGVARHHPGKGTVPGQPEHQQPSGLPGRQAISAQEKPQWAGADRTQSQAEQHLARFHHTLFRIRDRQLQVPDKGAQQRMVRTGGIAHPLDQQHALRQIHARDRRLHRRFAESILPNPPARLPTAVLSLDRSEIALPASRRTCRLRCRTDHQDTHRIETYAGDGAGQPEKG